MRSIEQLLPLTPLSHAILLALAEEELHGYAIMKAVESLSDGRVKAGTGTLYAALQRMLEEGLIAEAERDPDPAGDARRRYFAITEFGRHAARAEAGRLSRLLALAERRRLGPLGGEPR